MSKHPSGTSAETLGKDSARHHEQTTEETPPAHSEEARAAIRQAAQRLLAAEHSRQPAEPVRPLIGDTDIAAAYAVQRQILDTKLQAGAKRIGRKIGLTSTAVQQQVGVEQPDFGVLLDNMRYTDKQRIPFERLLQPRAEAEIAFVLAEDILDPDLSLDELKEVVSYASPALEIVDSRVRAWDIAITDTVADNASSGVFVIGDAQVPLSGFEPRDATMRMTSNGEQVSAGDGAACLGNPLTALLWLARTSVGFGDPLQAGEVILSGALGPLGPVTAGQTLVAEISGLGTVTTTFI